MILFGLAIDENLCDKRTYYLKKLLCDKLIRRYAINLNLNERLESISFGFIQQLLYQG